MTAKRIGTVSPSLDDGLMTLVCPIEVIEISVDTSSVMVVINVGIFFSGVFDVFKGHMWSYFWP